MRFRSALPLLSVAILFTAQQSYASDKSQELRDRLQAAAELTSLEGSDLKPWHWKIDLTVFDVEGKNPKTGNLEMWFGNGNMRSIASLGSTEIRTLRIGDKLYRTAGNEKDLAIITFVQMQLLQPVPRDVFQPSTTVKLSRESNGAAKFDCIVPSVVRQTNDVVAVGRQFSFCFKQDTPKLLATYEPGDFGVLRMQTGTFQSHEVPVDLGLYVRTTKIAEAKTVELRTEPIDSSAFQIEPNMAPVSEPMEISSGDLSHLVLSQVSPSYPLEAKERHASGKLVFDVLIGRDGHVLSLQQIGQADASLAASAKQAVSHWVYRSYCVNGVAVEVRAKINVNFSIGN